MSNIDPAASAAPVPMPAPQTTPTPSAGEQKPDASTTTADVDGQADQQKPPATDAGAAEQAERERKRAHRQSAQERINEAVAAQRSAERQRDEILQRVLDGQLKPEAKVQANQQSVTDLKEPRETEFTDYGDYLKARDDYLVERTRRATAKEFDERRKADEGKRSLDERKVKAVEARERFDKSADSVADSYEDFDDVMEDLWAGKIAAVSNNDSVAEFIMEHAERGPELVYFLDKNPKEAKRIAALTSPIAITRELTRLEASLPKPKARTVTNAPTPPKELGGKGGADILDPEKMSPEQYRAWRKTPKAVS